MPKRSDHRTGRLFGGFTQEEKQAAIKRELNKRVHVYPRLIANGKMTQDEADYQMSIFEAILIEDLGGETRVRKTQNPDEKL